MSFIHKEKPNSLQYHKPHIHQTGQGLGTDSLSGKENDSDSDPLCPGEHEKQTRKQQQITKSIKTQTNSKLA